MEQYDLVALGLIMTFYTSCFHALVFRRSQHRAQWMVFCTYQAYIRKANISFRETHGLYGFDFSLADEYALAAKDRNPLVLTNKNSSEMLMKGKELYTAMCQHCHGEKGDGNGPMVLSGAYVGVPAYADRSSLSDGQIFYSIYYGKGMMGAHNSLVSKKEIWTLVHYVRQFQNPDYGKFDESGNPKTKAISDSSATKTK